MSDLKEAKEITIERLLLNLRDIRTLRRACCFGFDAGVEAERERIEGTKEKLDKIIRTMERIAEFSEREVYVWMLDDLKIVRQELFPTEEKGE